MSEDKCLVDFLNDYLTASPGDVKSVATELAQNASTVGFKPRLLFLDLDTVELSVATDRLVSDPRFVLICLAESKDYLWPAFKAGAVDYLLKPVTAYDLVRMEFKVHRIFNGGRESVLDEKLVVRADRLDHYLRLGDILYLESSREYVIIHLINGKKLMTLQSMGRMLASLPAEHFVRIHRSFTVAVRMVTAYSNLQVMVGGKALKIGSSYRVAVHQKFAIT